MKYKLRFTTNALKDIQRHKKSGDKKILKRIEVLLEELRDHPKKGTGKPEKLKHGLQGYYSRRINKKHRIVYSIKERIITVLIISTYGHYDDK